MPRSERQRVEQIADRYRAAGYEVTFEPNPALLPQSLREYLPDFIATLTNEKVAVEVKTEATSVDFGRYRDLAEALQQIPGWRLDLVVTGGPKRLAGVAESPLPSVEAISRQIDEAEGLAAAGHDNAALLLGWAAVEAVLRLKASSSGLPEQRSPTATLLKELVSQGVLARDQYERVWNGYKSRNAVAHGFVPESGAPNATSITELGRALLMDYRLTR